MAATEPTDFAPAAALPAARAPAAAPETPVSG